MTTFMAQESRFSPKCLEIQLKENEDRWEKISQVVRKRRPQFAMTIGRGSSDHACLYAKYLFETQMGLVTASAAPSICTLYNSQLQLKNALIIAISQSGESADLCEMMSYASKQKAITIAITNNPQSPLASISEFVVPIYAGEEKSVAATKSYIGSLSALIHFISKLSKMNLPLWDLPEMLELAIDTNWTNVYSIYEEAKSTLIVGRGFQFPVAHEAALKCKETAILHAEAFSGAEILHGPFALVKKNFPILSFLHKDKTQKVMSELITKIRKTKAYSILTVARDLDNLKFLEDHCHEMVLLPKSLHPLLDPLVTIQSFYVFIEKLSRLKGLNPDNPQNLKKITSTK